MMHSSLSSLRAAIHFPKSSSVWVLLRFASSLRVTFRFNLMCRKSSSVKLCIGAIYERIHGLQMLQPIPERGWFLRAIKYVLLNMAHLYSTLFHLILIHRSGLGSRAGLHASELRRLVASWCVRAACKSWPTLPFRQLPGFYGYKGVGVRHRKSSGVFTTPEFRTGTLTIPSALISSHSLQSAPTGLPTAGRGTKCHNKLLTRVK